MSFLIPDLPGTSTSSSERSGYPYPNRRKRTNSDADQSYEAKRLRRSSRASSSFDLSFQDEGNTTTELEISQVIMTINASELGLTRPRPLPLAGASSLSRLSSRHATPELNSPLLTSPLIRSASMISLRSMSPSAPHISECSARHHMKSIKTIDFSVVAEDAALGVAPVSWSAHNCLVFGRNNRVYWKNMGSIVHSNVDDSESAFQFAKIRDSYGRLTHVDCAGKDQQNTVALGTSKGCVQIWDIATKKMTMSFSTSGVSAMKWNGPVLTIGGPKGAIRHFDTRISPSSKMKEQTKKVTRHQAKICNVAYNMDGIMLASGDETGLIHCWDLRQKGIPMDVGDVVQRRKKMQHIGPITALNWSPWSPKLLASGDSAPDKTGTIRTWNIVASLADTNSNLTHTLPVDCTITSLNFSPHCKEILATHGHGRVIMPPAHHELDESPPLEPVHSKIENCAVVWNYPTLMEVSKVRLGDKAPTGGLISPNGQRAVLAIPEEGHLRVYDVWSKPKESLRRNRSSMDLGGLIR